MKGLAMLFPNPVARLRKAHYALEDLPDTITFPQHPARETEMPLSLEKATIDDVAFAIAAADEGYSAAYRRAAALKRLYVDDLTLEMRLLRKKHDRGSGSN